MGIIQGYIMQGFSIGQVICIGSGIQLENDLPLTHYRSLMSLTPNDKNGLI